MKAPTTKQQKAGLNRNGAMSMAALLWLMLALPVSPAEYAVNWFTVDGVGGRLTMQCQGID